MPHVSAVAGLGCVVVALALQVTGLATVAWIKVEAGPGKGTMGLWELCATSGSVTVCHDLPDELVTSWLQAVRVFAILAAVDMMLCLIFSGLMVARSDVTAFKVLPIITAIVGAVCSVVALSVYADEQRDKVKVEGVGYDYSFFCTVGASAFSLFAAVFFVCAATRRRPVGYANL